MEHITIGNIAKAVGGTLICGNPEKYIDRITTDSRSKAGGLFIALKGDKYDANEFVTEYLKSNHSALVSKKTAPVSGKNIIYTSNTNSALLALAGYYRSLFSIPVIGITGSVGKTSTKEMISCVLSTKYNTLKTQGNYNNEIGVPLTLFNIDNSFDCAVVEMGMSNSGEMSRLTNVVRPTIAVITNIGTAHIGNLGSQENILKAKLEILEGMNKDSTLILNADDDLLYSLKNTLPIKTLFYGIINKNADIVADNIVSNANGCSFDALKQHFTISAPGEHNIYNALAATLVGKCLGIPLPDISYGVSSFENCGMRQNIINIKDITLIEDCYNASLDSMSASLKVLNSVSQGRTIAVLGDILEQGEYAIKTHEKVGEYVAQSCIDVLITIGENSKVSAKSAQSNGVSEIYSFDDTNTAADYLKSIIKAGDTVLFKASHGMHLEEVSDSIKKYLNGK